MKKIFYAAVLLGASVTATAQGSKFDAASLSVTRAYQLKQLYPGQTVAEPLVPGYDFKTLSRADNEVAALFNLNPGYSAEDVVAAGLSVVVDDGEFLVVAGTMDDIIAVGESEMVRSASLSREVEPMLNTARTAIGQDKVHSGTAEGLGNTARKGAGVICGIFDRGIDPNHVNFYASDFKSQRIKRFWKYTNNTGVSVEYNESNIPNATTDYSSDTHGTHTTGCMAGSHNRSGLSTSYPTGSCLTINANGNAVESGSTKNPYYGMAPEATIVAAGASGLTDANILSAAKKILDYAKAEGKPAVFNLSIGTPLGAKDGTSSFCRQLDQYGKEMIIFVSAGNDGESNISDIKKLTAGDDTFRTGLGFTSASTGIFQVYSDNSEPITFTFGILDRAADKVIYQYDNSELGTVVLATENYTTSGYKHPAEFEKAFSGSFVNMSGSDNAATSGRRSYYVQYSLKYNATTNASQNLVPVIFVKGNPGTRLDIVNKAMSGDVVMTTFGHDGWSVGNPSYTINDMACGKNVICIGSYNTSANWAGWYQTQDGITKTTYGYTDPGMKIVGGISPYTSYGQLCDGRSLPFICAPGAAIVSSLSSYNVTSQPGNSAKYTWKGRDYYWGREQGTSMASPIAAGVVATWLEADPTLNVDQVKDILATTATKDEFLTTTGNPTQWGAGKINAYEGMKEVLRRKTGGVNGIVADIDDESNLVISNTGGAYNIFLAGAPVMDVKVYSVSGSLVRTANAQGDNLTLDASGLQPGVYVLNVNNKISRRVLVK